MRKRKRKKKQIYSILKITKVNSQDVQCLPYYKFERLTMSFVIVMFTKHQKMTV